ncbi:hypothetical protein B4U79_00095 [Dinothrombium tinctorium]|uniref:Integrase catalytic domain-containing protein n=1 Tax=Dinothrombium tinctorium TaxID=1965070 RepID=A0A443QFW9_9ACAR|nr:hypothetical protein B4U79_00095 [Dinothrombium tinctorium]
MENEASDITISKTEMKYQEGGFIPLIDALAPLLKIVGSAVLAGAASAGAKKLTNKIIGQGTRIIGNEYDGDGSRIIGKKYNGEGVFARNTIPKSNINQLECDIINNDTIPSKFGGTHWVAYYNHPSNKYVEFFDSFGIGPAEEIKQYLLTSGKKIKYNSFEIQNPLFFACGYYCITYILDRYKARKSTQPISVVKEFLDKQDTYTKHKHIKRKFETRRVFVKGIDDQFQADLVEMIPYAKENKGIRHMLTCIDVFSKYAWAITIKNKTGEEVADAFEQIFKERIPANIQTDLGKEFYNSNVQALFQKYNLNHFSSYSPLKASVFERFNRTLKEKIWKYFSEMGNHIWIDVIDDLVLNYNNSVHRTIKMTPVEASLKDNEGKVMINLYPTLNQVYKAKFKEGDMVRISKYKTPFEQGYKQNFTTEIFKIVKVRQTKPIQVQFLNQILK